MYAPLLDLLIRELRLASDQLKGSLLQAVPSDVRRLVVDSDIADMCCRNFDASEQVSHSLSS